MAAVHWPEAGTVQQKVPSQAAVAAIWRNGVADLSLWSRHVDNERGERQNGEKRAAKDAEVHDGSGEAEAARQRRQPTKPRMPPRAR